ncbi:MAG: hypothetical protein COY53_06060 [Elusimicrobia bacterium CG_4_10_14_0_8_um_filter_37_32]|nr:MAG: hypothetical protein COS17_05825 [Elusimicrobia bacterium CG02_land_8_20_14_3_00_37_13]PIZ13200.1 MAG: hypothetical protein COY53_06060 [Elusimicrobia bacterium CG_4_10_14_0_8_um_filter_37_32]
MDNQERAIEALRKIETVINEVRDIFPNIIKKEQIKIVPKDDNDPIRILKRVSGIIVNYNESNAERKLESLLKYLGSISREKK